MTCTHYKSTGKHLFDESGTCFECGEPMKPSEYCKQEGTTMKEVGEVIGINQETLHRWYTGRPALFRVVVKAVAMGVKP